MLSNVNRMASEWESLLYNDTWQLLTVEAKPKCYLVTLYLKEMKQQVSNIWEVKYTFWSNGYMHI